MTHNIEERNAVERDVDGDGVERSFSISIDTLCLDLNIFFRPLRIELLANPQKPGQAQQDEIPVVERHHANHSPFRRRVQCGLSMLCGYASSSLGQSPL